MVETPSDSTSQVNWSELAGIVLVKGYTSLFNRMNKEIG